MNYFKIVDDYTQPTQRFSAQSKIRGFCKQREFQKQQELGECPLPSARSLQGQLMCTHCKTAGGYTAVMLAFEELKTPYASGWEICVQNFGNAYQLTKRNKETNDAFQTVPLPPGSSTDSAE